MHNTNGAQTQTLFTIAGATADAIIQRIIPSVWRGELRGPWWHQRWQYELRIENWGQDAARCTQTVREKGRVHEESDVRVVVDDTGPTPQIAIKDGETECKGHMSKSGTEIQGEVTQQGETGVGYFRIKKVKREKLHIKEIHDDVIEAILVEKQHKCRKDEKVLEGGAAHKEEKGKQNKPQKRKLEEDTPRIWTIPIEDERARKQQERVEYRRMVIAGEMEGRGQGTEQHRARANKIAHEHRSINAIWQGMKARWAQRGAIAQEESRAASTTWRGVLRGPWWEGKWQYELHKGETGTCKHEIFLSKILDIL